MRRLTKIVLWCVLAVLIVVGIPMAYSTAKGYTTWYFGVPGAEIFVDGYRSDGRVHRGQGGFDILVSRIEDREVMTYAVLLPTKHVVPRCPRAPWFPVFAEGDLLSRHCYATDSKLYSPPARRLIVSQRSVAFTADDGKRIEARW